MANFRTYKILKKLTFKYFVIYGTKIIMITKKLRLGDNINVESKILKAIKFEEHNVILNILVSKNGCATNG